MLFSLIFLKPNLERLDFFDLMWIVGIADFVLKYLTIALKCLIVALPKIILAVKSKVRVSFLLDVQMSLIIWYLYVFTAWNMGGRIKIIQSLIKLWQKVTWVVSFGFWAIADLSKGLVMPASNYSPEREVSIAWKLIGTSSEIIAFQFDCVPSLVFWVISVNRYFWSTNLFI